MANTSIQWTDKSWNPTTGCTKESPGCKKCYAARMALRLEAMGNPNYRNGFKVTLQPQMLNHPFKWKKPCKIFVNSMSDLFHKDIPLNYIHKVFSVMNNASQHTFQVLTKRAERLAQLNPELDWAENIWMGVSIENADYLYRADHLRQVPAVVRFLSCEPLLGPLPNMNLDGIGWVIVGGESGRGARPINSDWVRDIRDQCVAAGVPFFFKQWGGTNKKKNGNVLDGQVWKQFPIVP